MFVCGRHALAGGVQRTVCVMLGGRGDVIGGWVEGWAGCGEKWGAARVGLVGWCGKEIKDGADSYKRDMNIMPSLCLAVLKPVCVFACTNIL